MRGRAAARLGWGVFALSLGLQIATVAIQTVRESDGAGDAGGPFLTLAFLAFPAVGALIVSRQPRNLVGWLLLVIGPAFALTVAGSAYAESLPPLPGRRWVAWVAQWMWLAAFAPIMLVLLVFPDGRLVSRRWRIVVWIAAAAVASAFIGIAFSPGGLTDYPAIPNPLGLGWLRGTPFYQGSIGWFLLIPSMVGAAASLIARFRRSRGAEREQLKWFALATTLVAVSWVANSILFETRLQDVGSILLTISILTLPVAAGFAILKYRLYDIDVVVRKTILYGSIAAFLIAGYVIIGTILGGLVGRSQTAAIVAAAVLGLLFHPVSRLARRLANRAVYGKRATPYQALTEFSERMGGTFAIEDLLPRMARIAGEATGAARADVWLEIGGQMRSEASWPFDAPPLPPIRTTGGALRAIEGFDAGAPVRHQGELLGALTIVKRAGEDFTPTETQLLENLASQTGLVLRNVRLIEDLRASRQRLVAAQDEERRKIERNLHDGAQQQLVALTVRLRLAADLIGRDEDMARQTLGQIQADAQTALKDLQDLARGIYPPLLADQGLVAALQAQARKSPVPVSLTSEWIGRYRQEVEGAVYFCCLEALQNVAKYAGASGTEVRLERTDGELRFSVSDNGAGFDPASTPRGSGLQNMADRLAALDGSIVVDSSPGGGTTVMGRIPASRLGGK